jgi:hypothetical protein
MGFIVESKQEVAVEPVLPIAQEKSASVQSIDPFVMDHETIEESKKVYFQIED